MQRYYDNTMLSAYKTCPRKYYFRHVRNWRPAGTSIDLIFGLAWHEAMDMVWLHAQSAHSDSELLALAYQAFLDEWLEQNGPDPDTLEPSPPGKLATKNPGIAAEMLHHYIAQRRSFLQSIELLGAETPFMVPLWDTIGVEGAPQYIGRLDKEFRHEGRVYIGEHKTTGWYSKATLFRQEYLDQWSPNSQVDGYLHAGHMRYGKAMKDVWVDAALCHKTIHTGFKFIPVSRAIEQLDAWLSETRNWIRRIEEQDADFDELEAQRSSFMPGWEKNTEACSMYTGCPYRDICKFVANPSREQDPPAGYIEEKWEPFEVLGFAQQQSEKSDDGS